MNEFENKVQAYMKEQNLIPAGGRVIVAVSGGADSVCLLAVLSGIAPRWPFSLRVLHVHHGLRGEEADRDEAYVRQLCRKMGVPMETARYDVGNYAREHRLSTEEAGRILRYQALEAAAAAWEDTGGTRIALAHHQEDDAETILHHLLRGSGLRGLSGIRPVQGRRIRPLLCVDRNEIEAYLRGQELDWCEDSTNDSAAYTRNRIRSRILPLMQEEVNARAVEHIRQAGEIMAQADAYLEAQADLVWRRGGFVCREEGTAGMDKELFCRQPDILRSYLVRRMLDELSPGWRDMGQKHVKMVAELAGRQAGARADLPGGIQAVAGHRTIAVRRRPERAAAEPESRETGSPAPEILQMKVFSREKSIEIPKNQYTKWFDYDRIKGTLCVRSRQTGDYLILPGGGHKPVARLMIDEKIPGEQRDRIPVLAEGNHVLWVVGHRISEYYKITDDTETILQVTYDGGESHGRKDTSIAVGRRSEQTDQ